MTKDESHKDLNRVISHFEKKGVRMSVAPSYNGKVWDLEEIENQSDVHGTGSEALQHLAMVADKHNKHITLLPAGAPGKEKHLTDYYKRHGFETHPKDPDLMVRKPGAKMNLGESKKTSNATHTFKGWKWPESRNDPNDPSDYFYDKDMAVERAWLRREKLKKNNIKEDLPGWRKKMMKKMKKQKLAEEGVPTNSMGASSSTAGTGAIDTFDPLLKIRGQHRKKRIRDMWKRKTPL